MYYSYYQSPLGPLALTANEQGLTALAFQQTNAAITIPSSYQQAPEKFSNVHLQLDSYFAGTLHTFDLPLAPQGTAFQQKVWQTLTTIKHGETKSYAWLAEQINNKNAVRAVGTANGANPIAIIIPCHRVIGSNGKLTGYAGGVDLKAKLLTLEGAIYRD